MYPPPSPCWDLIWLEQMLAWMWEKENTYSLLVRERGVVATMEISVEVHQKKLEIDLSCNLAIPLLEIFPKFSMSYYSNTCSLMLIAGLFTIGQKWKQLKHQLMSG